MLEGKLLKLSAVHWCREAHLSKTPLWSMGWDPLLSIYLCRYSVNFPLLGNVHFVFQMCLLTDCFSRLACKSVLKYLTGIGVVTDDPVQMWW